MHGTARINVARLIAKIERLNAIGVALSVEPDSEKLLETILLGAKELTDADGGSLYIVQGDELHFRIVRNDTLHVSFGGSSGQPVPFPPVRIERGNDVPHTVAAYAVVSGMTVNIADAYDAPGFDFSGTKAFDLRTGYRSRSFLTVPMRNHEGVIVGVLQLINSRDPDDVVEAFNEADQRLVESLASQAATALTKRELISGMATLFESFIELIATAIDEKSPYTGNHCHRVPELTMRLAEAAAAEGLLTLSDADRYELRVAAWLHDCGKVTTPEWVMDKATKLQGIFDRIELVATRFEVFRRDAEITCWKAIANGEDRVAAGIRYTEVGRELDDTLAFLRRINVGGEFMKPEDQERVRQVATKIWYRTDGSSAQWLTPEEVRNLTIAKGTLLPEEREIINNHIVATIKMLDKLPFPRHLTRVPEYACGHHERMDGKGYPKGLTRDQMSVQARIMGIADVFEALTAGDRPYKKAMKLSQALGILKQMADTGHIDAELHAVFVKHQVGINYGKEFLQLDQLDVVA